MIACCAEIDLFDQRFRIVPVVATGAMHFGTVVCRLADISAAVAEPACRIVVS